MAIRGRSLQNLQLARAKQPGHDTVRLRQSLEDTFMKKFQYKPYEWVDVAESILLHLDTVVIAGTGVGKTAPFMMPLLLKLRTFSSFKGIANGPGQH